MWLNIYKHQHIERPLIFTIIMPMSGCTIFTSDPCDLFFVFIIIFIDMLLFLHIFLEFFFLFLDDSVDEGCE